MYVITLYAESLFFTQEQGAMFRIRTRQHIELKDISINCS
jgi:hypothetical protein